MENLLHLAIGSASSMSKYSAGVNSDLGNGSFWVNIHDATSKYVD